MVDGGGMLMLCVVVLRGGGGSIRGGCCCYLHTPIIIFHVPCIEANISYPACLFVFFSRGKRARGQSSAARGGTGRGGGRGGTRVVAVGGGALAAASGGECDTLYLITTVTNYDHLFNFRRV